MLYTRGRLQLLIVSFLALLAACSVPSPQSSGGTSPQASVVVTTAPVTAQALTDPGSPATSADPLPTSTTSTESFAPIDYFPIPEGAAISQDERAFLERLTTESEQLQTYAHQLDAVLVSFDGKSVSAPQYYDAIMPTREKLNELRIDAGGDTPTRFLDLGARFYDSLELLRIALMDLPTLADSSDDEQIIRASRESLAQFLAQLGRAGHAYQALLPALTAPERGRNTGEVHGRPGGLFDIPSNSGLSTDEITYVEALAGDSSVLLEALRTLSDVLGLPPGAADPSEVEARVSGLIDRMEPALARGVALSPPGRMTNVYTRYLQALDQCRQAIESVRTYTAMPENTTALMQAATQLEAAQASITAAAKEYHLLLPSPGAVNAPSPLVTDVPLTGSMARGSFQYTGEYVGSGVAASPQLVQIIPVPEQQTTSAPTVAVTQAYVATQNGLLVALDLQTGGEVWRWTVGEDAAVSAPATADGVVYVASAGSLYALDAGNGSVRWSYPCGETPPTVTSDAVYCTEYSRVYALRPHDGAVKWILDLASLQAAGIERNEATAPLSAGGGMVYIPTLLGQAYALDALSGRVVWEFDTEGPLQEAVMYHQDRVFVRDTYGTTHILDAQSGREVWALEGYRITVAQGRVFVPDGSRLDVYDVATGDRQSQISASSVYSGPRNLHSQVGQGSVE
jgi:hypothetical protein